MAKEDDDKAAEALAKAKAARAATKAIEEEASRASAAAAAEIYDVGNDPGPSLEAAAGVPLLPDGSKAKREATPKAIHSGDVVISGTGADKELIFLLRKCGELGILIDPKWDANRLRGEIQMALEGRADLQVKGAVPSAEMGQEDYDPATRKHKIPLKLNRDYWPAEDLKKAAGEKIEVDREEAKRLMDAGIGTYIGPINPAT
jgi:hypothetical protein